MSCCFHDTFMLGRAVTWVRGFEKSFLGVPQLFCCFHGPCCPGKHRELSEKFSQKLVLQIFSSSSTICQRRGPLFSVQTTTRETVLVVGKEDNATAFCKRVYCFIFRVDDMSPETIEAAKKIISKKCRKDSQEDMETLMQRIKNIEKQLASIGHFGQKLDNILTKLSR